MPRRRPEPQRARWILPAVLTVTAAVATAGVYFWNEMENDEGWRSEDEREAHRGRNTPTGAGPSLRAARSSPNNEKGIAARVGDMVKGFFDSSSSEDDSRRDERRPPARDVSGPSNAAGEYAGGGYAAGAAGNYGASRGTRDVTGERRDVPQKPMNMENKRVIALVISSLEELEESLLLHLPTPLDLSRCILLVFIYTPPGSSPPPLTPLSPRPMPTTPSKTSRQGSPSPARSVNSDTYSVKSFARTQSSPPLLSAESSPSIHPAVRTPLTSGRTSRAALDEEDEDEDMLATPTPANRYGKRPSRERRSSGRQIYAQTSDEDSSEMTEHDLPSLISKTFGKDFPAQQIMHYSVPVGVVHMLRHLGVSIVFLSESCASTAPPLNEDSDPLAPPQQAVSGGEIVNMLRDWVGEIVLILDEDEDDSGPGGMSAVSGAEDEYYKNKEKRKGKERKKVGLEGTGRKRRWLDKEKGVGKSVTVVERARLGAIWRARVEGR